MKRICFAIAAIALCASAAAEPYIGAGGSAGSDQGALSAVLGLRSGPIAVEGIYAGERRSVTVDTSTGSGVSHEERTFNAHGIGAAVLGFAEVAKFNGTPLELVGRAERSRFRSGDAEEWRTSVGAGVQYGAPGGLALRLLFERAGDQSRGMVHLIKRF